MLSVVVFTDGDKCTSLARSSVLIPAMYAAHVQSIMREGGGKGNVWKEVLLRGILI